MSAAGIRLSSPLAARPGVLLVLWGLLAGCATTPGVLQPRGFARQRVLLASRDGAETGGESTRQSVQGYSVPGRNPQSQAPWEFFLGNAAHRLIAYMYGVDHPHSEAVYNTKSLGEILQYRRIGDPSRLRVDERNLRPDITDITLRRLYEIKPWNAQGLQEGRLEAQLYLDALNRALLSGRAFVGGSDASGATLIRFAQGQYIWRLEWQTTEPGVIQYRWTRSQQRFESASAAHEAGQWVTLSEQELRQYGGWVGQAVEGMVTRREQLASVSATVGTVIEIIGITAEGILMGAILGRILSGPGAQQPPVQGGGQVIPFPRPPPPLAPPAQLPSAAGM